MKYHKRLLIAGLFAVTAGGLLGDSALAWTINPDTLPKLKLNIWAIRCSAVEKAVENRIDKFESNKEKHIETYTKLKDRVSEKLTLWEDKGYDVGELKEDLKTLDGKIKKYATDYSKFIDELRDTQDFTCGSSEGEFKTALQEAKTALKTVRQDAADIRKYYQNTIRPDILDLKNQQVNEEDQ